jgi:hypothetical protein
MQAAKLNGRGDDQLATRGGEFTGGFVLLFTHEVENAPRRGDV